MSRDCSSREDYSQELPRLNLKRLEKCSLEKRQPYQPKPAEVETVDPNRTRPLYRIDLFVRGELDVLNSATGVCLGPLNALFIFARFQLKYVQRS